MATKQPPDPFAELDAAAAGNPGPQRASPASVAQIEAQQKQAQAALNATPAPVCEGGDHVAADSPEDPAFDNSIVCPVTGELVELTDVDGLIDVFERVKKAQVELVEPLRFAEMTIRRALGNLTQGETRTRRVAGRRRKAVVEMPGDAYDQSVLKEAFNSYPQFRDEYLRIESIAPKLREVKKLLGTAGPPELMQFRSMVEAANRGPIGTPTVKVEA